MTARFTGDAAQSFQQSLDPVVDGRSGMAAAAGEFCGPDTFELELGEKAPFLLG